MRATPIALILRLVILVTLLLFGVIGLLNATDSMPVGTTDWQGMTRAASHWLRLLDEEKYAEGFAAAAAPFREGVTVEDWKRRQVSRRTDLGAVVRRDEMRAQFVPSNDWKESMAYTIWTQTTFEKMGAGESLTMIQESGEWKVAHYTVSHEGK